MTTTPKPGTVKNPIQCETWSEAFSLCREKNRPIVVVVMETANLHRNHANGAFCVGLPCRIYPSGSYRWVGKKG